MSHPVPDPVATARREAERLTSDPGQWLDGPIDRVLLDAPFLDRETLLSGVESFHRERMDKIPSPTVYPESVPWVDYIQRRDRELQSRTGLSDRALAAYRSLSAYLTFRGSLNSRPARSEKCRVVYLPQTDRGQLHIKNLDDPLTFWEPAKQRPLHGPTLSGLIIDGVGSGLHLDDEPDEIFPLPARQMCHALADDVPGAVQFLTRYSPFWGGANVVVIDPDKRSVAIEKSSYNYIEVFEPGPNGGSHCSGMACRDPHSPQGVYQARQRNRYLEAAAQPADGPDATFWTACDRAETMLGDLMRQPAPTVDEVLHLFTTPWPAGLNKTGAKLHPLQGAGEYTLETCAALYDRKQLIRWQRDVEGKYPAAPELLQF